MCTWLDQGKRYIPFLSVLAGLVASGVDVRLIHAKEPGTRFRKDFDRFPDLVESERFERILCPRMHMKVFIVDGRVAYVGSANLTGAGVGAKSPKRRNFEAGLLTDDRAMIGELMAELDELYLGNHCIGCGRRDVCPGPDRLISLPRFRPRLARGASPGGKCESAVPVLSFC